MSDVICLRCNISKKLEDFNKDKTRKTGHHPYCRECQSKISAPYFEAHKQEAAQRTRTWTENNEERVKEYNAREDVKARKKEYIREYRKRNKERKRETSKAYEAKRSKEDVLYKITNNLRKRLGSAIKGNQKSGSAVRDLGCTIEFLKSYLESLFKPGMSWENWGQGHGKWQIDHIEALCLFDLTDRNEFLRANHYTNLSPIWYEDHIIKTKQDIKKKKKRNTT